MPCDPVHVTSTHKMVFWRKFMGHISDLGIFIIVGVVKVLLAMFVIGFYFGFRYKNKRVQRQLADIIDGILNITEGFKGSVDDIREKVTHSRDLDKLERNTGLQCSACDLTNINDIDCSHCDICRVYVTPSDQCASDTDSADNNEYDMTNTKQEKNEETKRISNFN